MTPWLTHLAHESNGRPFTSDELDKIAQYVEFLPDALAAVKKLDDSQKWLVRHMSDWVAPQAQAWGLPKDPFTTDFAAFLAAVGYALLCDDIRLIDAEVAAPFRSLAVALEVPAEEFAGLFDEAWRVLHPRLDPLSAKLLEAFFARAAWSLRDGAITLGGPPQPAEAPFPELVGV